MNLDFLESRFKRHTSEFRSASFLDCKCFTLCWTIECNESQFCRAPFFALPLLCAWLFTPFGYLVAFWVCNIRNPGHGLFLYHDLLHLE